jgi:hypothetical protein
MLIHVHCTLSWLLVQVAMGWKSLGKRREWRGGGMRALRGMEMVVTGTSSFALDLFTQAKKLVMLLLL